MKITFRHLLPMLMVAVAASFASAQSFTEDFGDGTLGPNLELKSAASGGSVDATSNAAVFSTAGAGDIGRAFVGTVNTYTDQDFVATIDFTIVDAADTNSSSHFFGIGNGQEFGDGGGVGFSEPVGPDAVFVGMRGVDTFISYDGDIPGSDDANNGFVADGPERNVIGGRGFEGFVGIGTAFADVPADQPAVGTHTLRLTHTLGTSALFEIDAGAGFQQLANYDLTDNNLLGDFIFFGSSDGRSFDNLSVTVAAVPEPSSMVLIALSGMALAFRRRR